MVFMVKLIFNSGRTATFSEIIDYFAADLKGFKTKKYSTPCFSIKCSAFGGVKGLTGY